MAVESHVPLGKALDAVGIDSQALAAKVTGGATDLAECHLQVHAVSDRASRQQFMDGHVTREKRQTVGHLEDSLVQSAAVPQSGSAQRRFLNELKGEAWSHLFRALSGPTADQVPHPQAEQLGDEQPDARQVSHDLVGEELSYAVLNAARIRWNRLGAISLGLDLDGRFRARAVTVEFFFEGRSPR